MLCYSQLSMKFGLAAAAVVMGTVVASSTQLSSSPHQVAFSWKNVALGGGGCWVTGIVASNSSSKSVKNALYIRTDCGGAYRYSKQGWVPITDWLPFEHRGDYGIESIAVDPHTGANVYIASGGYTPDSGRDAGTIYRSSDYGKHWKQSYFNHAPEIRFEGTTGLSMCGNGDRRWGGERLVCDPGKAGTLLFGSRYQGLWYTDDNAKIWNQISGIPSGKTGYGITAVSYDPRGNGIVYAAVEGVGIYDSKDHGRTWKMLTATPSFPATVRRMTVASDGKVWMTFGVSTSGNIAATSSRGGIAEYIPDENRFKLYDPVAGGAAYYIGLGVNPANPDDVIAAASTSLNSETGSSTIWQTGDAGKTWTKLDPTLKSMLPWYKTNNYTISDFLYDPHGDFGAPGSVWYTDGTGIWHTNGPVKSVNPTFVSDEKGHEEMCVTSLCCPVSGRYGLLAGVMDQDGFAWKRGQFSIYPKAHLINNIQGPWSGIELALSSEASDSSKVVTVYSQSDFAGPYHFAYSSNGGKSWVSNGYQGADGWVDYFPQKLSIQGQSANFTPLAVAISNYNPKNVVVIGNCLVNGNLTLVSIYTTNGVSTRKWNVSAGFIDTKYRSECGIGEANTILQAGNKRGVFYAVNGGNIYKSTDSGASFMKQGNPTKGAVWGMQKLQTVPGANESLWYSAEADTGTWQNHLAKQPAWEGLYHSTNGGHTWTKLHAVSRCITFALGAKKSGSKFFTLYYLGRNSEAGLNPNTHTVYYSTNGGESWSNMLKGDENRLGDYPLHMTVSMDSFGRVFVATEGRGIFYSQPTS